MKTTSAKWLFIHSDCEFYRDSLAEYDIQTKSFQYAQNFGKGKDHSGSKVEHIYVKNYWGCPITLDLPARNCYYNRVRNKGGIPNDGQQHHS